VKQVYTWIVECRPRFAIRVCTSFVVNVDHTLLFVFATKPAGGFSRKIEGRIFFAALMGTPSALHINHPFQTAQISSDKLRKTDKQARLAVESKETVFFTKVPERIYMTGAADPYIQCYHHQVLHNKCFQPALQDLHCNLVEPTTARIPHFKTFAHSWIILRI
jgi:hypothetical protein